MARAPAFRFDRAQPGRHQKGGDRCRVKGKTIQDVARRLLRALLGLQEDVGHEDEGQVVLLGLERMTPTGFEAKQLVALSKTDLHRPPLAIPPFDRLPPPSRVAANKERATICRNERSVSPFTSRVRASWLKVAILPMARQLTEPRTDRIPAQKAATSLNGTNTRREFTPRSHVSSGRYRDRKPISAMVEGTACYRVRPLIG
jgi:hypothetical protein